MGTIIRLNNHRPFGGIYLDDHRHYPVSDLGDNGLKNGRRIPTVAAERIPGCDGLRYFCRVCNGWHEYGPVGGYGECHCIVDNSPHRQIGVYLMHVDAVRLPYHRARIRYTRDGSMVSGFLLKQKRPVPMRNRP
jgi:hypothetical protein